MEFWARNASSLGFFSRVALRKGSYFYANRLYILESLLFSL